MEYYSALKRKIALTLLKPWVNLRILTLSKKDRHKTPVAMGPEVSKSGKTTDWRWSGRQDQGTEEHSFLGNEPVLTRGMVALWQACSRGESCGDLALQTPRTKCHRLYGS